MPKRLLTVGGIAAATGAPAPTIRAWVRRGLIKCQRDSAGRRLFDQYALSKACELRAAVVRRIRLSTEAHMCLKGTKSGRP